MIETLTITGTKKESLSSAIKMLQSQAMNKTIAGYRVDNDNLLFYYHEGCKGCKNKWELYTCLPLKSFYKHFVI